MAKEYPLEQVTRIKQRRLEDAEKVLQEKKKVLEQEQEKLKKAHQELEKIQTHKEDKLAQLRHELDTQPNPTKIQQMKVYLKEVDNKVQAQKHKVTEQEKKIDIAEKAVEAARQDMFKKQQAVEKMHLHKKEWSKEEKKIETKKEADLMDEVGTTIFTKRSRHE